MRKNGQIEFLRFISAIVIVLRHGSRFLPKGIDLFSRGSLAVEFFFLVSGYLMACSCAKALPANTSLGQDTRNFIKRKYFGLMPEFLIAWIINFILFLIMGKVTVPADIFRHFMKWLFSLIPLSMAGFSYGSFNMAAWYISAMLLAMLILYPIGKRYFDSFVHIIAPLLAIFIIGFMAREFHTTLGPTDEFGFTYKGMIRAIAEISLGSALYPTIQKMKAANYGKGKKFLLSLINIASLCLVLYQLIYSQNELYDVPALLLMAVIVTISFSHQGLFAGIFDNKLCYWLGHMSLIIYFCHPQWVKTIGRYYDGYVKAGIYGQNPAKESACLFALYFGVTAATCAFVCIVSAIIRKLKKKNA